MFRKAGPAVKPEGRREVGGNPERGRRRPGLSGVPAAASLERPLSKGDTVIKLAHVGAASFLAAPVLGAAGVLAASTMSDDAAPLVAASTDHHGAMIASAVLQTIGISLFIAGIVWLATAVAPRARALGVAGGILGVTGALVIVFEAGLNAAVPPVVSALRPANATKAVDAILSSTAGGLEPLSTLQPIGCLLLAIGAVKAGAPRWAAAVFAVGGFVDTAGFATGTKALVVVGFVLTVAGIAPLARHLVTGDVGCLSERHETAAALT
jgi:hypothetical protein